MKNIYSTENLLQSDSPQPLSRLFKSWLALGLLLNLGLGQLQLPIGPLWLWLVLIPALCALAVPGILVGFVTENWPKPVRFGLRRGRAQARRRPAAQA